MIRTSAIQDCRRNDSFYWLIICLPCTVAFSLLSPGVLADEPSESVTDADLAKIYKLFECGFPGVDPVAPYAHLSLLEPLIEEGIDPFPVLREIAFDPKAPTNRRVQSIAWIGELANPDTGLPRDDRSVPCLQDFLKALIDNPDMQGDISNNGLDDHPLDSLLSQTCASLSQTRDESSVDLMLPLTSAEFWNSDRTPDIKQPPHVRLTPEKFRITTVESIRTVSVYSIARSGTERSLEVLAKGDQIDLTGISTESLDELLETAICRRAGFKVVPEERTVIPEEKRRELEAIRQRVETQYLPLRGKPVE